MQGYESVEAEIRKLIEELNPEIFVVDLTLNRSQRNVLSILLQTDTGISIDEITKVSRKIGQYFEEEGDPFPFAFNLEVSSPGVGKPIMVRRQYFRNIGRRFKVIDTDGLVTKGKLLNVDEEGIHLVVSDNKKSKQKPSGKKTGVEDKEVHIKFDLIKEAKVEISFD